LNINAKKKAPAVRPKPALLPAYKNPPGFVLADLDTDLGENRKTGYR